MRIVLTVAAAFVSARVAGYADDPDVGLKRVEQVERGEVPVELLGHVRVLGDQGRA
jgi:autonomous glycyl radical cofactor GrcA